MELSPHAAVRLQQRALSIEALGLVLSYGEVTRRQGADVCYLTRSARQRLREDIGHDAYRRLEPKQDVYAVMNDAGELITAAHRYRRLKRA